MKSRVDYLEGNREENGNSSESDNRPFDHAVILFRVTDGSVGELRIENSDRELDAGGVRFIWVNGVDPEDSVKFLAELAHQSRRRKLRESAVFIVSLHQAGVGDKSSGRYDGVWQ